jgi:ATP-dependent Lon protease
MIQLAGYSDREKLNIAKQYLVPRQIRENGLTEDQIEITDNAINLLSTRYTREAGVRQLERSVGNLARKVALKVAQGLTEKVTISAEEVKGYLGPPKVYPEEARKELPPGVATGMAWTEMGGEVLFIEATMLPGGSGLTLTGQLGDVMKESAQAARSYLWSHAAEFGIDPQMIKENGVHLHVPAGAIPKDGPSAGVTMATALASLYTGRKVRSDTSMTGEITLSGLVFPVGGIKEKVLAAHRAGITRVVLPGRNEADAEEIPEDVRKELEIIPATWISDVLNAALEPALPGVADETFRHRAAETQPDTGGEPLIAKDVNS